MTECPTVHIGMTKRRSQNLIFIFVVLAVLTGLVGRWWLLRSTIHLGTIRATETSGPVQMAAKLSAAISRHPNASKFIIQWIDPDTGSSHTITYDRKERTLVDAQQLQEYTGGLSFSRVTDDKVHAVAKSSRPIWGLSKHGCAAAAWVE